MQIQHDRNTSVRKKRYARKSTSDPNFSDVDFLSEKPLEGSYINCFKVVGPLPGPPSKYDAIWGWRHNEWNAMSGNDIEKWEIIEEMDDIRVLAQVNKLPWPLWARDVSMAMSRIREGDAYYLILKSIVHPKIPENSSQYVRAQVLHSAFAFLPDGANTKFVRIVQVEPSGNIPSSIVNSQSRGFLNIPVKLRLI